VTDGRGCTSSRCLAFPGANSGNCNCNHAVMGVRHAIAVGVIPARWASTRLPGKPLADIGGKSLIQRTFEQAKACKRLDHVVVATDDARIVDACRVFGAPVVLTPSDCATGTDRVAKTIAQSDMLSRAQLVVNIQGDEPFINPGHIGAAVDALANADEHVVMSTLATQLLNSEEAENTNVVKVVCDARHRALYFSRARVPHGHASATARRNVEGCLRHVGLYVYRRYVDGAPVCLVAPL
jgi:3-deoxy-manno-octulosonate cytidylyltransferase (CMP-KDO synthetase)